MKTLVIYGSPRRKLSASYKVTQRVIEGLKKGGSTIEEVMLADKNIKHCIGCFTCWTKTPGVCVHKDDMPGILEQIRNADLVIHASPLYFYDVTSLFKTFCDRQLPLAEPWLIKHGDHTTHPYRGDKEQAKTFLVSVCGFPERTHFDSLVHHYEKIYGNKGVFIGHILLPASELLAKGTEDRYEEVLSLAEKAGLELARDMKVSEKTSTAIVNATTMSDENKRMFIELANSYWQSQQPKDIHATPIKVERIPGKKPLKISDGGTDAFFAGMALSYNPSDKPTSRGVLQFDLNSESWHLVMDGSKAEAFSGKHHNPSMTVVSPKDIWFGISDGSLNGQSEFIKGSYRVDGDMSYLMEMNTIFGDSNNADDAPKHDEVPASKLELSEKRGPIGLSGTAWITVTFIPWMLLWIWGSIVGGWLPRIVASGLLVLILLYHSFTNKPTLFESGSVVYMTVSSLPVAFGWPFFVFYAPMIDYIFLAGLWMGSSINRLSLTAEYSGRGFPNQVLNSKAFLATNVILSSSWGIYFLIAGFSTLVRIHGAITATTGYILMAIQYTLLILMFIFTGWFQKWYPERMLQK